MPVLSVVIPIYGVEAYIEECVRSLLSQTLEDIEYIFVNDCTPDSSMDIIEQVLQEYPHRQKQVKYIHHTHNLGLARTREDGIRAATGQYIASCDSDDWVDIDMYAQLLECAQRENAEVVVCDMLAHIQNETQVYKGGCEASSDLISDLLSGRILPFIHSCVFRRELLDQAHLLFAISDMAEDLVVSVSMAHYSNKVSYVAKPFYHYRINEQSISRQKKIVPCIKRTNGIKENTDLIISFLSQNNLLKKYSEEVLLRKHIVKTVIWPMLGNKNAYTLWKELYPEIHWQILKDKNYTVRTKLLYILTIIGLYPLFLKIR